MKKTSSRGSLIAVTAGSYLALVVLACGQHACGQKIVITPPSNAPPSPAAASACAQACSRASAMCGPLGDGCVTACERDQAQGIAAQLDPQCVIDAATPAAMTACGVPCSNQ